MCVSVGGGGVETGGDTRYSFSERIDVDLVRRGYLYQKKKPVYRDHPINCPSNWLV